MLIGELLRRRATVSPGIPFWEQDGVTWHYGEFNRAVNRLAHALLSEGLAPGTHIAICAAGGIAYAQVHFAAAKAGLVLTHLNASYTTSEVEWILQHSGAELVFFGHAQAASMEMARVVAGGVKRWVALGAEAAPAWAEPLDGYAARGADDEPAAPAGITAESPFQLLYTSGTTGYPKGALIPHRSKLRLGQTHALNIGLQLGDRIFGALPMHHHYAQWLLLTAAPLVGATVLHAPHFDVGETWAALAGRGMTHLPAVPTTLERLAAGRPEGATSPRLRHIVYGGAPVAPALIPRLREAFPGVRLFQGFGQTETGYCLGLHDIDHDEHPDSLGRADLFSEIRLLDEEGNAVQDGEPGEIVGRTPYLMTGYHADPEASAEYFRFGPDWGRTGDLATRDKDGFYHLAGRKQELIITGGVNVYPAEVERVLLSHPAVHEAAVFGMPHEDWGEAVTAVVILREGWQPRPYAEYTDEGTQADWAGAGKVTSVFPIPVARAGGGISAEDLMQHCRLQLAAYKVPKFLAFTTQFPRTTSGKLRKIDLMRMMLAAAPAATGLQQNDD